MLPTQLTRVANELALCDADVHASTAKKKNYTRTTTILH